MHAAPRRKNGRSPARVAAVTGLAVVACVAVMFALRWFEEIHSASPVSPPAVVSGAPAAEHCAPAVREPERSDAALPASASSPDETRRSGRAAHRIEARDAAGNPVRSVQMTVHDEEGRGLAVFVQTEDGNADLDVRGPLDRPAAGTVVAAIPGRIVTTPLQTSTPSDTTRVEMGAVGTLRVTWRDPFFTSGAVSIGTIGENDALGYTMDANRTEVQVAADGRRYAVLMRTLTADARCEVTGPRFQGDVVDVAFDLRRCTVVGRLGGPTAGSGEPTWVRWVGPTQQDAFSLAVAEDGAISFLAPLGEPVTVVFARTTECAVVNLPALDVERHDIGTIVLEPRPVLGLVQVRDSAGTTNIDPPNVIGIAGSDGKPLDPSRMQALVCCRPILGRGLEILGAPGVASATLDLDTPRYVCEPATLVVSGGGTFTATRVPGGRVVLEADASPTGLHGFRLREVTTGREYEAGNSRSDAGRQRTEFSGLRAGRYAILVKDADVIGGPIAVQTGMEQSAHVTVRPR